jgi:catechol 2,3-dioxygenase-like lactoylglutathione lyase family enzyme
MTRALRILRIERTVTNLRRAAAFYENALGFMASPASSDEPASRSSHTKTPRPRQREREGEGFQPGMGHASRSSQADSTKITLHRGAQTLVLISGGSPENVCANHQSFQHIALPVTNIAAAFTHLQKFAPRMITQGGPVLLPPASGGAMAIKFYDPDGHPVEFLQFPDHRPGGVDHSAIVVADAERSIAFYRDTLGLRLAARQTNTGPEQDRLDGLIRTNVDVIALTPGCAPPHVELLAYRSVKLRPNNAAPASPTRFVFEVDGAVSHIQDHDPDGHPLTLVQHSAA